MNAARLRSNGHVGIIRDGERDSGRAADGARQYPGNVAISYDETPAFAGRPDIAGVDRQNGTAGAEWHLRPGHRRCRHNSLRADERSESKRYCAREHTG